MGWHLGDGIKSFGRLIGAPVERALGMNKGDQKAYAPKQQFAYGSAVELAAKNKQLAAGEAAGSAGVSAGLARSNDAADVAAGNLSYVGDQQSGEASQNQGQFYKQMANYGQARTGQAMAASALMRSGQQMPASYQRTDQASFNAQQDLAQRQALALGARGGAGGIRAALASSAASNVANQNQANITRANETNQLQGLQQNAYTNAAGVMGNVGAQDQGAAGVFSGRQQTNQANAIGATTAAAGIQQNAANAQTTAGADQRNSYLNADQNVNLNQLAASQDYDQQRQANNKANYVQKWQPVMSQVKSL